MGVTEIMNILHRPPMLLVDKIYELSDSHVIAAKNVTIHEPFLLDISGNPLMPGVLIVEAIAQAGGVLLLSTVDDPENYLTLFMKIYYNLKSCKTRRHFDFLFQTKFVKSNKKRDLPYERLCICK